jgi:hypothetical protein
MQNPLTPRQVKLIKMVLCAAAICAIPLIAAA